MKDRKGRIDWVRRNRSKGIAWQWARVIGAHCLGWRAAFGGNRWAALNPSVGLIGLSSEICQGDVGEERDRRTHPEAKETQKTAQRVSEDSAGPVCTPTVTCKTPAPKTDTSIKLHGLLRRGGRRESWEFWYNSF